MRAVSVLSKDTCMLGASHLVLHLCFIFQAVSHKDLPHENFFFYNGLDGQGLIDKIGS